MKRLRLWLRSVILRWLGYRETDWQYFPGDNAFVTAIYLDAARYEPNSKVVIVRRPVPEVPRGTIRVVLEVSE